MLFRSMLTRMQDEVHRYAITSHINKRNKGMFIDIYDKIKGIGPKKKELLNKTFPTMKELYDAKLEEFEQILPKALAIKLCEYLHGDIKDE